MTPQWFVQMVWEGWVFWLVTGLVVSWFFLVFARNAASPLWIDVLCGVVGAFIGGYIYLFVALPQSREFDPFSSMVALIVAALFCVIERLSTQLAKLLAERKVATEANRPTRVREVYVMPSGNTGYALQLAPLALSLYMPDPTGSERQRDELSNLVIELKKKYPELRYV